MRFFVLLVFLLSLLHSAQISYYEDLSSSHNADTIVEVSEFKPYKREASNFGMTKATLWLRIEIQNSSLQSLRQVLNFTYPLLDSVELYKVQEGRARLLKIKGNFVKSSGPRHIEPNLSFYLDVTAQKNLFYVKISSVTPMNIAFELYDADSFENYKMLWFAFSAFYVGAVVIILLYNLIIYFFVRSRTYLYYLLFHTSFLALILLLNGFGLRFVFPENPEIAKYLIPLMIVLTASLQMVFVYELLEIKKYGILSKKIMRAIMGFGVLAGIGIFFLEFKEAILIANMVSLVGLVIPLAIAFYYWLKFNSLGAKYYSLAWLLVTLGVMIEHLKNSGLIAVNSFTVHAMQLSSIAELLMLSLALAYRFNQLQDINTQLNDLVVTDPLTKVRNRRYFITRMQELQALLARRNEEYTLVMLDIDHFKRINDTYGHAAGDKVLMQFAQKIASMLRLEDVFARIGGEEFVLLARSNRQEAEILTKRIKESIEKMSISCDKGEIRLSVSMGVTFFDDNTLSSDTLLKEADSALYAAKIGGRNRVEFFERKD